MIRGFAEFARERDDVSLFIFGEGTQRAELTELIEKLNVADRAFLLGYVPDARRYLTALDIFTLTSTKEGHPYALLEAGMAGLPVLASDISGIADIVTHEHTGLLVPADDADSIADGLRELVGGAERREALGTRLRAEVRERFVAKRMWEETCAIYA